MKNKKRILSLILGLGIGVGTGLNNINVSEYNVLLSKNSELTQVVSESQVKLEESNKELDEVLALKEIKKLEEKSAKEEKALAEKKAEEERLLAEKKAAEEKALAEKKAAEEKALAEKIAEEERIAQENANSIIIYATDDTQEDHVHNETPIGQMVWLSATGSKYHNKNNCGNMNPNNARQVSIDQAISSGFEACKKYY